MYGRDFLSVMSNDLLARDAIWYYREVATLTGDRLMLAREKKHVREAVEHLDIDLKFILRRRKKIQAELDGLNDNVRAAMTRLQNLETYIDEA